MTNNSPAGITLAKMDGGEDWLLRPVLRGMCKYDGLKDCSLDLDDVALMNEAIDIEEENKSRIAEWVNAHGRSN